MLALILIICVGLIVIGLIYEEHNYFYEKPKTLIMCVATLFPLLVFVVFLLSYIGTEEAQERIELLTEHNIEIETRVRGILRIYLDGETEHDIDNMDLLTILIIYPELTTQQLVRYERDLYIQNSEDIKKYEIELINRDIISWWLWFF